jgi:hypothetical protein
LPGDSQLPTLREHLPTEMHDKYVCPTRAV